MTKQRPSPKQQAGRSAPPTRPSKRRRRSSRRRAIRRRAPLIAGSAVAVVVVVIGVIVAVSTSSGGGPSGPVGPEGATLEAGPALAAAAAPTDGSPTAGVSCGATEQIATHVHAHLAVYVDGQARSIPLGIGFAGQVQVQHSPHGDFAAGVSGCLYYLHTHASDGIIHVEAPEGRQFVLGQLFAIWGQPLKDGQVGPAAGPVTAYFNGHRWTDPLEDIPLRSHEAIQLDIGTPVVTPQPFRFPSSL